MPRLLGSSIAKNLNCPSGNSSTYPVIGVRYLFHTGDRGRTLARRSRSRQLGLGRVGPSGSEATGWHHYDGAREIITERSRGRTAYGRFEMRSGISIERRIFP